MKYRLSTLLLSATCIALALGWYLDLYKHKQIISQLYEGTAVIHNCYSVKGLDTAEQSSLAEYIDTTQITCVLKLFLSADAVSQTNRYLEEEWNGSGNKTPLKLAARLLETLHCTSPEQYFDRLNLLDKEGGLADYLPGGEQHKPFRQFVEKALQPPE